VLFFANRVMYGSWRIDAGHGCAAQDFLPVRPLKDMHRGLTFNFLAFSVFHLARWLDISPLEGTILANAPGCAFDRFAEGPGLKGFLNNVKYRL
jgi:hypothetical protein